MTTNKIGKDEVLNLIKEEAYIITEKRKIYEQLKKYEETLKHLNECTGLAGKGLVGTFGFQSPTDSTKKTDVTGFVEPMNISHIVQLAKDMEMENPYDSQEEGFGDEFKPKNSEDLESIKKEHELLKKELSDLKAMLNKK